MIIDLEFPVRSQMPIPVDHGYRLYGAISRILPAIHEDDAIGIHPIAGRQTGDRRLMLTELSTLKLRVPDHRIGEMLLLSGTLLDLAGSSLRVGTPRVRALEPAATVRARLVTIKGFMESNPFMEAVRRQFEAAGISTEANISIGKRRTLQIKDKQVVGFELLVDTLNAEESLRIQETGIGGRRHMGCGIFVPIKPREELS